MLTDYEDKKCDSVRRASPESEKPQSAWQRKRRILAPPQRHRWWSGKSQSPTVLIIDARRWRIFFCARSTVNRIHNVYIDVDPTADMKIIDERIEPMVTLGGAGTFDSDGIAPSCFASVQGKLFLYYSGLNLDSVGLNRIDGPEYQFAIGALVGGEDGAAFDRRFDGPVMTFDPSDHHFVATPYVLKIGDTFHMWYASVIFWRMSVKPHPEPCYNIKYAVSDDGVHWRPRPDRVIDFASETEGGICRPWVVPDDGGYEMWYCYRGQYDPENSRQRAYKIGYARSTDGLTWQRRDREHVFVNPPQPGDWDFEMQCYPSLVQCDGKTYMFYCGNGYGDAGFGYAERVAA